MVKADVKHNYYADLELPTNCSLDDIKKQYRKLALLYHPDRNAGKEEEYVPRFQAIQTAHEILGDAGQKARYDADRRKAGLSATGGVGGGSGGGTYNTRPSQPQPTGNPYQATSAYPPPPRRTQPGTWQRPQASGTGRFNNFPRSTPTARKDPAQDRTNMFKAWQNMNNPQDRQQQRTTPGSASSTTAQTGASTPTPNRPRPPPPPPRADPKMPSEEEIRAGMNYRKPPPQFDGDRVDRGQSAWASFQQKNQGKPGVSRSSTTKTPRKQGFDPSAPGSDERPAGGNSGYAQRHRSEDYGRPQPGQTFPPPPPGPPPQSPPSTRTSPTAQRPFADPLRPFKSRTSDDGAPYSEANRRRTPYSSFSGEKFHFQREENDNLRRSASTRDTSKLDPNSTHASRARSTSPLGRQAKNDNQAQGGPQKPFVDYSDSDDSDERPSSTAPEDRESASPNESRRPGTVPHSQTPFERPKKVPTPPSQRFGGSSQPFSPPPPSGDANQAEPMQQKTSNNMYVNFDPFKHNFFSHPLLYPDQFAHQTLDGLGIPGAPSAASTSFWAYNEIPPRPYPSFGQPNAQSRTPKRSWDGQTRSEQTPLGAAGAEERPFEDFAPSGSSASSSFKKKKKPGIKVDIDFANAPNYIQSAYSYFCGELECAYGDLPESLDMSAFLVLASTALAGVKTDHDIVDAIIDRTLSIFPYLHFALPAKFRPNFTNNTFADSAYDDSFSFPISPDMFTPNGKSKSTENINTQFSPEGWNGEFKGSPDYFSASAQPSARKASSPFRRDKPNLRSSAARNASASTSRNGSVSDMPPPPPPPKMPSSSDEEPQQQRQTQDATSGGPTFSKEEWEKHFQEPSWAWPPPPQPPSPSKVSAAKSRGSKKASRGAKAGNSGQSQAFGDSTDANAGPEAAEDDAMDIDTPPTSKTAEASQTETDPTKEPRLYSVPPSQWRQQQQAQVNGHGQANSSRRVSGEEAGLKTNLDDLANVEPMTKGPEGGLKNLSDLSSTLPFQSQPSAAPPRQSFEPQKLSIPPIPKAPEQPSKLTRQSWQTFANSFGDYLQAYHHFNSIMLQHFTSRESHDQSRFAEGTAWLEAVGDPAGMTATGPIGFGSYLQGVREDESVREAWNMGCERHTEACKGFEKVRERVRKLVGNGGLVDH
ncbi:hypothetical protein D0869_07026 [Hortaea werneckii]|uniref:J domain-containing protein n=2 Tax=Hortaea werneckii TaxID=91943 RepID=A0A3M7BNM5_HORWE|nr:hypothetical protein KC334_g409 [Hortaea werneckii]KAI7027403.1 hypothetical protein KC355_g345 [Hortaea werneckii]KAI7202009.1 hypothetical protein KC324_g1946 [Hortaea werneckii]KAI7594045.1 hypothetical protein KC316_g1366 [Hortaea werneckii]RMX81156.1 hypothetical protein D0869_07026 [Hortaea werneckii]